MQKIRILTLVCVCILLLNGCRARQLEEREFVQAMELEWNGETLFGGFSRFCVQGQSVDEIREMYQEHIEKYLDLGHVKVLILGKRLMNNQVVLERVLREMEEMPVFARNILVLSYEYETEHSVLQKMEEKGIVPGESISNLYKNNPRRKSTVTLGELTSTIFDIQRNV